MGGTLFSLSGRVGFEPPVALTGCAAPNCHVMCPRSRRLNIKPTCGEKSVAVLCPESDRRI